MSSLPLSPLRLLLCSAIVLAGLHPAWPQDPSATAAGANERPNIVWIVAENIGHELGCYGEPRVETPHIDRLAENGIRYTRVFATAPVCATSRSAFMTGMYQTTTDTHHMRSHREDGYRLPPGTRPLTHRLQDAGYRTANISKIGDRVVGTGKLDLNFTEEGPIYQTDDSSSLAANQPFFAQINTPEVEYDIYDRQTAAKERVAWVGEQDHPQIATEKNVDPPPYYPDHPLVRREWARYLNSISGMDRRVGWVLEQLQKEGLADNTVILFFADNGRLEARGIHWCWDSGLLVPMIVHWPEPLDGKPADYRPGTVDDQVVSLLDLTATTLRIAGIDPPLTMQSRTFLGDETVPRRTYAFSARDRIDETVNRIRSVRGPRYHYLRNFMPEQSFTSLNRYKEKCFPVKPLMRRLHRQGKLTGAPLALMADRLPAEELYDTWLDPHEINNLAGSQQPPDREALLRMRAAVNVWMTETGDRGHIAEPAEVVVPFEQEMHDWFGTPDWYQNAAAR